MPGKSHGQRSLESSRVLTEQARVNGVAKSWTQLSNTLKGRDILGGPVVKTVLPLQGAQVQSLVRELKSHMLLNAA